MKQKSTGNDGNLLSIVFLAVFPNIQGKNLTMASPLLRAEFSARFTRKTRAPKRAMAGCLPEAD